MESLLDGVQPINGAASRPAVDVITSGNSSVTVPRAPAMQPDAITASVLGRQVGLDHPVQRMFDELAAVEKQIAELGPRPTVSASVPSIPDPRCPFSNSRSLGNVLTDAGLTLNEVQDNRERLKGMITVLPDLRRSILAASGSTRKAAYRAAVATVEAIGAELKSWEKVVMKSADEEPVVRQFDAMVQALDYRKNQARKALAHVSASDIQNYKTAVEACATRAEMRRMDNVFTSLLSSKAKQTFGKTDSKNKD